MSSVYGAGGAAAAFGETMPATANPTAQGKNPYTNEIFTDQKDYEKVAARAE